MKKIYFLLISIFTIFMLNSTTAKANSLNLSYDESKTLTSISKDEPIANYLNNFIAVYNDKPIIITPGMISLDTSKLGEQIATVTYDNQSATTSAIVCTPSKDFSISSTSPKTISKYIGSSDTVVIPKFINKTEITTLGNSAFIGRETLTSIVANNIFIIEDSIYNEGTFALCENLKSIHFFNLKYIGKSAFIACSNLYSVNMPKVNYINDFAFRYCENLKNISLLSALYIGDESFRGCSNLITINIPNVTFLGNSSFFTCSNLRDVFIPKITSIGNNTFALCDKLDSITFGTIPPKSIGKSLFAYSSKKSLIINIPKGTKLQYEELFSSKKDTFLGTSIPKYIEY